jgi:Domain of unknown function (DUF4388)
MAAQYLTTSRLNNIINMIMLGRQSGILRVIRGQGHAREFGQIKFVDGEPIAALLGQVTGPNALTVLMNWGECVYAFDEQVTSGLEGDPYDQSSWAPSDPGRSMPTGPSQGSWPSYGYPYSYPAPQTPPASSFPGPNTSSSLPGLGSQPGYFPTTPSGYPNDLPRYDGPYGAPGSSSQRAPSNAPLTASALAVVPRRTVIAEHVDQLPLDRRERMLLLLVDNRRNLADLARLTRRSEREVLSILEHLSSLGLVQIGG